MEESERQRRRALRFIVLMGLVSLFADMTYEVAKEIALQSMEAENAPFLASPWERWWGYGCPLQAVSNHGGAQIKAA